MSEPMEVYRQACVALEYLRSCTCFYDYKSIVECAPVDVQELLETMSKNLYIPFYSHDMVWDDVKDVLEKAVSKRDVFERKQELYKAEKEGMYALLNKVLDFAKD